MRVLAASLWAPQSTASGFMGSAERMHALQQRADRTAAGHMHWSFNHVWPQFVLFYLIGLFLARRRYA